MNADFSVNATTAILSCDVSPAAKEIAAPLVNAYLQQFDTFPDSACRTHTVEKPWRLWLDQNTLIVGVMDRIFSDGLGLVGHEHKTKGEPRKKKDGEPRAGNTEDDWLAEISGGIQVGIYALAMREAEDIPREPGPIRILVRACIKAYNPEFWPRKPERGVFEFSDACLDRVKSALLSKAAQIRAARQRAALPWQLPGLHCTNKYRRDCEYLRFCRDGLNPAGVPTHQFDMFDPASAALKDIGVDLQNESLVILSASLYQTACQCPERYRIMSGGYVTMKDSSLEQEVGTAYHAALAAIYRQHMEITSDNHIDNA